MEGDGNMELVEEGIHIHPPKGFDPGHCPQDQSDLADTSDEVSDEVTNSDTEARHERRGFSVSTFIAI
ncbi:hypothetical protein ACLOJK_031626 [Asimina triloba]